ncbi:MAG: formylglycine-generating enzyme family protein [Aeoliella sp.]
MATRLVACVALVLFGTTSVWARSPEPGLVAQLPAQGRFVKIDLGYMVPYEAEIPGTDVKFTMVPIPGGKFLMGSQHVEDEGPQFEVEVEPFWMGAHEITWAEYHKYMALLDVFKKFESLGIRKVTEDRQCDAITAPTKLYDSDLVYESGDHPRQPAVMMTQYAAKQYTKWLTAVTGQFCRLPSEAEWEYACRAGTTTASSWGDDANELEEHALRDSTADDRTHQVGQKKPNAWGLYDMHGNVAEWVLDAYTADGYARFASRSVKAADAIQWPTKPFPLVALGGMWGSEADECRSASRLAADDDEWKDSDPNLPLSPWWCTSYPASGVGFRIVRPLDSPQGKQACEQYWEAGAHDIVVDVEIRIGQESGLIGIVDEELPRAIQDLDE